MASTINATTTGSGGLITTGNSVNQLELQTGDTTRLVIDGSGNVTIQGQGDLRLADSDSSHYVALQAPGTVASNVTFTLPSTDGTSGQFLSTNGSGTLSFASPASNTKTWSVYTSSSTYTVPAGVTSIRAYAIGAGGNGGLGSTSGHTRISGGGGGGMAYGDIAVSPGASVTVTISAGVATVVYNATTMLTGNPGSAGTTSSGSVAAGGAGGTATKDASVTNGGTATGGAGGGAGSCANNGGGGGASGSPLGTGGAGGSACSGAGRAGGGGGWGGAGGSPANNAGGGGGAGGAGGCARASGGAGGAAGSLSAGVGRSIASLFSDPILAYAVAPGVLPVASSTNANAVQSLGLNGGPGAGGAGAFGSAGTGATGGAGGDFGGGGGAKSCSCSTRVGGAGGLGGGGGAACGSSGGTSTGGNGGYGGGGGAGYHTRGTGGGAIVLIYA